MNLPLLRNRTPSEAVTGANMRIRLGAFGQGSPLYAMVDVDPNSNDGIYDYHEGALFSPGTGNFVFEPEFELPLQTIWGRGFTCRANAFSPLQTRQVFAYQQGRVNGLNAIPTGDWNFQPLVRDLSRGR